VRPLDLDQLRTFIAVTDRQGFAPAAELVHRTQSAVTQQMARLEDQLGVPLFQKVGRSKQLTDHGVRLLEYARRLLALNDEALHSLAAPELTGPLRIGAAYDLAESLLPPLLARFSQLYPNVQVEVHAGRTAHLAQAMRRGDVEICLIGRPEGSPELAHPSVRLRTSPMVWMAAADYVHDPSQPVSLILPDEPSSYRASALASLNAQRIPWCVRHVSTSLAFGGVRAALLARLGVTVRVIEMLGTQLRVLGEAEGLPRLPSMHVEMCLRDKRVSAPARRLFESVGDARARAPVHTRRVPARRKASMKR
jgi:DNA-binding transcriptional LysR family regulator